MDTIYDVCQSDNQAIVESVETEMETFSTSPPKALTLWFEFLKENPVLK